MTNSLSTVKIVAKNSTVSAGFVAITAATAFLLIVPRVSPYTSNRKASAINRIAASIKRKDLYTLRSDDGKTTAKEESR